MWIYPFFLIYMGFTIHYFSSYLFDRFNDEDRTAWQKIVQLFCFVIALSGCIFFTVVELRQMRELRAEYLKDGWNIVDLISFTLNYTIILFHILELFGIDKLG